MVLLRSIRALRENRCGDISFHDEQIILKVSTTQVVGWTILKWNFER
jgi:hypothetical protein